jgi:hypothetical protein
LTISAYLFGHGIGLFLFSSTPLQKQWCPAAGLPGQHGEQKANITDTRSVASSRCRVSFTDSEGILHGVDVDAESPYEAMAIAVASLREDDVSPSSPGPMTEFTVLVYRNPTEHIPNDEALQVPILTKKGPAFYDQTYAILIFNGASAHADYYGFDRDTGNETVVLSEDDLFQSAPARLPLPSAVDLEESPACDWLALFTSATQRRLRKHSWDW